MRSKDRTPFQEFVKSGDRENHGASSCVRYLAVEPGVSYCVKVTVKKGFRWDGSSQLNAGLTFIGEDECATRWIEKPYSNTKTANRDEVMYLDCINSSTLSSLIGSPFTFRPLIIGKFKHVIRQIDY